MTTEHPDLEFTIGVCVPVRWEGGRYILARPLTTTDGGLFEDACTGAWSPVDAEWIDADDHASRLATGTVRRAIARVEVSS